MLPKEVVPVFLVPRDLRAIRNYVITFLDLYRPVVLFRVILFVIMNEELERSAEESGD